MSTVDENIKFDKNANFDEYVNFDENLNFDENVNFEGNVNFERCTRYLHLLHHLPFGYLGESVTHFCCTKMKFHLPSFRLAPLKFGHLVKVA